MNIEEIVSYVNENLKSNFPDILNAIADAAQTFSYDYKEFCEIGDRLCLIFEVGIHSSERV